MTTKYFFQFKLQNNFDTNNVNTTKNLRLKKNWKPNHLDL